MTDKNTTGAAYKRFDEILATEAWWHSFTLHAKARQLEHRRIKKYYNGDETTYSGAKYGRGKPTCSGVTQWFQTITLLYKVPGAGYKIADFAIIPIADRKAHTMVKNIHATVLKGARLHTDCHRSYFGLGKFYEWLTVNHSKHFKDPVTKAHTNHVESLHSHLKDEAKGGLGQDHRSRVIRVMASSVLYRGAMTINNSTRFLAALQALQFVADRGLKLWEPLTLSANHKVPNLMGTELDDDQAIAETQLLTSADATPIVVDSAGQRVNRRKKALVKEPIASPEQGQNTLTQMGRHA
eukprot:GILI01006135.1.p1 GENE.GILI01006135.1~~GILI01006135.1.p1  ORF type:complete len:296 (+),score=62.17 GILI01006135.1:1053-1940(+)